MNESKYKNILNNLTYRKALWLTPLAFLIHLIEEIVFEMWEWESKFLGQDNFTRDEFLTFNFILMVLYFLFISLHHFWSNRPTALFVLIGILTLQFQNATYHLIFTINTGAYSPGLISGLMVYIPLNCVFIYLAYREKYINKISGVGVFLTAGLIYWIYHFTGELIIVLYCILSALILIVYYVKGVRTSM